MEKEMRKLLLVAVSVGVFLLVTITVALVLTTPNGQRQEASLTSPIPISQGRVQPDETSAVNISGQPAVINIPEITFNIDNIRIENDTPETAVLTDKNNGDSLTIQIPVPSAAAAAANTSSAAQSAAAIRQQTPPPYTAASASVTSQSAVSAVTQSNTAASSASSSTAARTAVTRTINDFWIQIGAYSAMVRAEDARELLASKGLVSIIENREINGQNLFRVRLGPYTSEREANHWLAIVKEIDGFTDSQVRQTVRQQ